MRLLIFATLASLIFCLFFVCVLFGFLEERRQALPNPVQWFVLGMSVSDELPRTVADSN